jgi:hypothetical protein
MPYLGIWLLLICFLLTSFICVPCEGTSDSVTSEMEETIDRQVWLSENAQDRDSKIEHLEKALELRPDHPDNLAIEFRIAVLMSQNYDPEHPLPMRRRDAVNVYQHILDTYDHMAYYKIGLSDSLSDMQLMVPLAAIHMASLNPVDQNRDEAKRWTHFAMQCLAATYERRKSDWMKGPSSRQLPEMRPPWLTRGKLEQRRKMWSERRERAVTRDVFGKLEMTVAEAAVRQYLYSSSGHGSLVAIRVGQIIKEFPETPMAKIAQRKIGKARPFLLEDAGKSALRDLKMQPLDSKVEK